MSWLESLIEDYLSHKKVDEVLYNDLVVNFQCTDISKDKLVEVDDHCYKAMKYWCKPEYHDEYLRKLDIILKDPHYYLYTGKIEAICKL